MEILLPQRIKSTFVGYESIVSILYPIFYASEPHEIIFDFSKLEWFDANLLPILGVCFEEKAGFHTLKYKSGSLAKKITTLWAKNSFGRYFRLDPIDDTYKSTVSYSVFNPDQGKAFGEYIDNSLLSNPKLPTMTPGLKKRISQNIQEIFGNAPMHGRCKNVVSCGQLFHVQKRLLFTIANIGCTIQENVIEYFSTYLHEKPPAHTIEWAVIEDHSTKPIVNGKSGGKGLAFLHEFITENGGSIQICSGNEYWESNSTATFIKEFSKHFPGTIVTITINLNDHKTYMLRSEVDDLLKNLF